MIAGLLAVVAPGVVPLGAALTPDDVAPTHLDGLPPELDADFATRVASDQLVHMECQGYRDTGFSERTVWYHLGFALRNRGKRRVRTVALWLTSPPTGQPLEEMGVDDITVKVTTVVLQKVRASVLLSDARTVSFAAGAHKEGRSTDELCAQVAAALKVRDASWAERHMAVVAAAMRGRYRSMVSAMEQVNLEPVVIEDLVKFGEDRGLKKGLKRGLKKGELRGELRAERSTLRRVLALRELELSAEQEQQIKTCTDLATLRRWHDQAIFAESAAEALR
ncbi:MAG: hypothetical protein IT372_23840 [Polyangiaceae bacterium]|nr:hypothetical protein [Polyangiaceae bacterium]